MSKKIYVYTYNKNCEVCNKPFVTQRYGTKICSNSCVSLKLSQQKTIFTEEQIKHAIELKLAGKSSKDIETISGVRKTSQTRIFKERNVKLAEDHKKSLLQNRWKDHNPIKDGKKQCSKCKEFKDVSEFNKSKRRFTGLISSCKSCQNTIYEQNKEKVKQRVREYASKNKEIISEKKKAYYEKNKESFIAKANVWATKNKEKRKEIEKNYRKNNREAQNYRTSKYRAKKVLATPKWIDKEHELAIRNMYLNCPKGYHVDHIVPLSGDNVSGLHVIWNLQYLPSFQNESKSNKVINLIEVGTCHQHQRKLDTLKEDIDAGLPTDSNLEDFTLESEKFNQEHRQFIERYEWLGTIGYAPKWAFTARHKGILGGIVLMSEPNSYSKQESGMEALISRGATASWTPKNLGSKLIMYACRQMVKNTEKRVFFGYSDHSAGEIGTIYQACNFLYLGPFFGAKNLFKLKNGKEVTSRYFRKTSSFKRYAKELGIEWQSSWDKANRYMDLKAIPKEILFLLRERSKQEQAEAEVILQAPKGKYVLFLGKNKKDLQNVQKIYNEVFVKYVEYPKRKTEELPKEGYI